MTEHKKAASSFWLGSYSNWQFSRESTENMLVITKVIHSLEKMIHSFDHSKKMTVRLATDIKATSDWSQHKIVLPPQNMWTLSTFPSFAHVVDLWAAMALHEAAHIVISNQLETFQEKETHLFIVLHVVEDFWIEHWITEKFPGYHPFLQSFKQFYYEKDVDLGADLISQKINDLIYAVNGNEYTPTFEETTKALTIIKENWNKALTTNEIETWNRVDIANTIFQLLFPHGLAKETNTEIVKELELTNRKKELVPTARSTQTEDVGLETPSPFLLSGMVKKQQTIQFHRQVKEGKKISWASEEMMETWLKDDARFSAKAKKNADSSIVIEPKVTTEAMQEYKLAYERVKPFIFKMREKFKTASTPRIHENIFLQQGALDEDALYRTQFTTNIFKTTEERYDAMDQWEITLLIDQSKSTGQAYSSRSQLSRYEVAMDIAVLFVEALAKLKLVELKIFAFSTAMHSNLLQLDELYSAKSKSNFAIGTLEPKKATPEFMALKEVTLQMAEQGNPTARKLIIILSDGQPDCYTYGNGLEHQQEIKTWIQKWSKRNFKYVHVSLDEKMDAGNYYGSSITFDEDYRNLVDKISKLLTKMLL